MSKTAENLFSPQLMKEIREHFLAVERDPVCGPRIFLDSAGYILTFGVLSVLGLGLQALLISHVLLLNYQFLLIQLIHRTIQHLVE